MQRHLYRTKEWVGEALRISTVHMANFGRTDTYKLELPRYEL